MSAPRYYLIQASQPTGKLGGIPACYVSRSSCPASCPLIDAGCYAEHGNMALHWPKTETKGVEWSRFIVWVQDLPRSIGWRYGVAGDLPGDGKSLDAGKLAQLALANDGRKAIIYTHYRPTAENIAAVQLARAAGLVVRFSVDTREDFHRVLDAGLTAAVRVPHDDTRPAFHLGGAPVVTCPHQTGARHSCRDCGLCADPGFAAVAFRGHGSRKKLIIGV